MAKSKSEFFPSTRLAPLEFRVFRQLQALMFDHLSTAGVSLEASVSKGERWLVACSGGHDSIALAHVLSKVAPRLGLVIGLAHVHHGTSPNTGQVSARDRALRRVRKLTSELRIPGYVLRYRGAKALHSEADLREFRLLALEKIRKAKGFDRVAFAHHRDDLFETRLIRLLRGTGAQGLRAMEVVSGRALRPLLGEARADIQSYAATKELKWVEDPSNAENGPLRNWLRNEWLPNLDEKRQGSSQSMMRSLENLVEALDLVKTLPNQIPAKLDGPESPQALVMDRDVYDRSKRERQRQMIASLLLARGLRDFTSAHVEEIRKRLDSPRQSFEFRILRFKWVINAGCVRIYECASEPN